MISRKSAKGLVVWMAVVVVLLMVSTSFSSAFYAPSNLATSKSSGSHVYIVTTTVGNHNYRYYEKVQNGKVVKTWPAPSTVSAGYYNGSYTGSNYSTNSFSDFRSMPSQVRPISSKASDSSVSPVNRSLSSSMDHSNTKSTFNVTQKYSLTSITLSPTSSNLYVGQTLKLKGAWSGGQSPYDYVWRLSHRDSYRWSEIYYHNSSSHTGADFNFVPKHTGTYLISLTVNGSGPGSGMNASTIISVQQHHENNQNSNQYGLQNITLAPTTTLIYGGLPITFSGNWTGSSSAYGYAWVVTTDQVNWKSHPEGDKNKIDNYNVTTNPSTSFTFNPVYGSYGIFFLYLYVIPSTGHDNGNQQDSLVAYAQIILLPGIPGVSSVTISPSSVNANSKAGVPVTFTGNWTGGTGPYSYAWMVTKKDTIKTPYILQFKSVNDTRRNFATFKFTPKDTGQYYVYLFVKSTISAAYMMAVSQVHSKEKPEPTVSQVTLTPTTVDASIGEALNFNANWTGGTSPYTYIWYVTSYFPHWQEGFKYFKTENITTLPSAQFTYIPADYGIYYLYLFVNNHVGESHSKIKENSDDGLAIVATAEIIVLHPSLPLNSSAISISPTVTTIGNPINATVAPRHGIAPLSYSWTATTSSGQNATSDFSSSGNQITFNTAGSYTVTVKVTDATGATASLTTAVTVNPPLSATIAISGLNSIDSGQSVNLVLTSVGGGIPSYRGQWLDESPQTSTFINLTSRFDISTTDLSAASASTGILTATGNWVFELKITDSTSNVAYSNQVTITVDSRLSVALTSPAGTEIGAGGSITFDNTTQGGTEPYTYSYSVSPSTGWTQSSNPGNTFTFATTGTYTVTLSVKDGAGSIATSSVTISVVAPIAVKVQPLSYSIDPGQAFATLTSTVEYGTGSYTWQWYSGSPGAGSAISGASGSGSTAYYTPTKPGTYYVVFKDSSAESVLSNGAVVTVNQEPIVSVAPSSATIDTTQELVLSSSVSGGSGSFTYSWTIGGSASAVGTGTSYTFSETTPGHYKVWLNVTDTGTTPDYHISPVSVSISVHSAPTVTVSPSSATIESSQAIVLTSTVHGRSHQYSYSWTIGGSTTVVGTSSSYSFSESSAGTYKVWLNVTDKSTYSPFVFSATVPIVVEQAPSIAVEPKSVTIDSGQSISMSSAVTGGTGLFSWQWYDSSGKITGASGIGLTASYTFSAADTGIYVIFTDTGTSSGATPSATATSSTVSVTVKSALSISVQPASVTIASGQTTTLSSKAAGGTGSYSWSLYTSSDALVASGTGATASYHVSPTSTTSYYFVFIDTGVSSEATPTSSVTSNTAKVTVTAAPTVTITPSSGTIDTSQALVLSSTVSGGSGAFSYAWTIGSSTAAVGTKSSYSFSESTAGKYSIVLTITDNTTSYATSATASIIVYASPSISSQPTSVTIDSGQSISITSAVAGGTGSFSWQWYDSGGIISGDSGTGVTASATFSSADTGVYVEFTDTRTTSGATPAATATSSTASVTVDKAPSVSIQPSFSAINSGQSVTLTSTVTGGTGRFSWSLYTSSGTLITSGTGLTGSYSVSPTSTTSYYFVFTDTGVSTGATPVAKATSNSATITVNNAPTVSVLPSSAVIDSGQSITLNSTVVGGSGTFAYNWTIGGSKTSVGQGSSYLFSSITPNAYKVWLNVTDTGTATNYLLPSVTVAITVDSGLTVSAEPISATIDSGQTISLSSTVSGGTGSYFWQWYDITGLITGASGTGATASTSFSSVDTGIYVEFKDTGTTVGATPDSIVQSSTVKVKVDSALSISVQPSSGTIDSGQPIMLTSTVTGGTGSYSWKLLTSSGAVITSSTGATASYQVSPTTTTQYYFAFTDTGVTSGATPTAKISSKTVTVTVSSAPTVTISPSPAKADAGQSITLTSAISGGVGPFTYKWTVGGSITVVGTGSTYSFSGSTPGTYYVWLNVTDTGTTPNYEFTPVSVAVTVNSALSIVTQPNSATIDPTQSISITSVVSGGTGYYSWKWYDSGGAISGGSGTGSTASATFSSSDGGIYVVFTDTGTSSSLTNAPTVSSDKVSVTLKSALSITAQPAPYTVDSGQSATLTATVTGGTGTYSWTLYTSGGTSVHSGTTALASYSVTPSSTASYYFTFTDTGVTTGATPAATTSSNTVAVTVDPALVPGISPSSATLRVGQSQTFTSTTTGGTGSYKYAWTVSGSTTVVSNTNSYAFSESSTGTYKLWLNVTDTGTTEPYTLSITATVQVNPGSLSITFTSNTPSSGSGSMDLGQSITLSITPTINGGTAPYTYQWYQNGTSTKVGTSGTATSGTAVTYVFTPPGKGTYLFYLNISSTDGQYSLGTITIKVFVAPTISSQPSSGIIDSGQSISITSAVAGGTGSFSWQWYGSGGIISGDSGTGVTASATFGAADSGIYIKFTDTGTSSAASPTKTAASTTASIKLDTALTITVQPTPVSINPGQSATLSSTVSGGTGTYSWSLYTGSGALVKSSTGGAASYSVSPSSTTSYFFVFTDTGTTSGATPVASRQSNAVQVTVNSATSVTVSPPAAIVEASQSILLTSTVTGGSGKFSYVWNINGSATTAGTQQSYSFSEPAAGTYKVWLNVTDTGTTPNYPFKSVTVSITVEKKLTVSITPSSATIDVEQSLNLSSTVSGGTGTFTYSWTIGANPVGTSSSYSFLESAPSTYKVWLNVTDTGTTDNYVFTTSATIVVKSRPTVTSQSSSLTINSGQSVTLTSTVTGGTGTFSWSLYTTPNTLVTNGTGATASYQLSPTSTTSYYFVFTDTGVATGATPAATVKSSTATVTVNTVATVSISPSSATIDSGQSLTLQSIISGGTGPFDYSWNIGGSSTVVGTGTSYKLTESSAGTYIVWLNVTDTGTTPNYVFHHVSVTVKVDSPLSIITQPTSVIIDNGQSITLTSTVSGGTGKYSWQWYDSGVEIAGDSGTGSTASATFSSGDTGIYVVFTDTGTSGSAASSATAKSSVVAVKEDSSLSISVQPNSVTIDSGQSITLTSKVTGGTGSYSWILYTSLGDSVTSGNSASASYQLSPTSTTSYYFVFTDTGVATGATPAATAKSSTATVTVNSHPTVSISPSSSLTDVGQSITLTASPIGGSGSFSYSWAIGGSSTVVGTKSTYYFTASSPKTYKIYLNVTDNNAQYIFSATASVVVDSSISISIQPATSSTIDLGQSVALTSTVTGGTGTFSWIIYNSSNIEVGSGSGASATYNVSPQTATSYYFVFTDTGTALGASPVATVKTNSATVTVNPNLTVSVLPVTIYSGHSISLTGTASGGSGRGYRYNWYSDSSLKNLVYTGSPFTTPLLYASTTYYLTVTDSMEYTSAPTPVTVTVISGLTSSSLSISPLITDVGNPVTVSVGSGQGIPPYSYTWTVTLYPSGSATGDFSISGNKVTFNTAGNYSVTATVKDSGGGSASITKTIAVNQALTVVISPSNVSIDSGNSVSFTVSTKGGTAPFTYYWTYPSNSGISRSLNTFTFANTGNFTVKLYISDTAGENSSSSSLVSVNSQPVIILASLNVTISGPAALDIGQSGNLVISYVSGNGPYDAQVLAEAPGASAYSVVASSQEFSSTPESVSTGVLSSVGTWHLIVKVSEVSDPTKYGTSSPVAITVVNALAPSAISISPTVTDVGNPIAASVLSGYGVEPFNYVWDATVSGTNASEYYSASGGQITFNTAGTYYVTITVTDADGITATASVTVTVNSILSLTIYATTPTKIDQTQTVTFSNSVSGGVGPYTYSYSVTLQGGGLAFGDYTVNGNVITFSAVGKYVVSSMVTDGASATAISSNSASITVSALPSVKISPSSTSIDVNQSVTFTNSTIGGTAPFTFIWSYPSGKGISRSGNNFTFAKSGNFTIGITVVDAVGQVSSSSSNVSVSPSPVIILQPVHSDSYQSQSSGLLTDSKQSDLQLQKKTLRMNPSPGYVLDVSTPWSVSAAYGTSPYTFSWNVTNATTDQSSSGYLVTTSSSTYIDNTITFTAQGTYDVTITVVDSGNPPQTASESIVVKVNPALDVTSTNIQTNSTTFDLGGNVTLTVTPSISGGTSPYTYQWYLNGTTSGDKITGESGSIRSGNTVSLFYHPNRTGNYTFYLVVADNATAPGSSTSQISVVVSAGLIGSALSISPTSTIVGNDVNVSIEPGYGAAPFIYSWNITLPSGASASAGDYSIAPSGSYVIFNQPGNYNVNVTVTDKNGTSAYTHASITVYSPSSFTVTITSPSSSSTVDENQAESIAGSFSGGSGTYEYSWVVQTSSTPSIPSSGFNSGSSPQSYTFSSSSTGTYYVFLYVKDTVVGDNGYSFVTVVVNSDLTSSAISLSPMSVNVGNPITASVELGYGTAPFTYAWNVTLISGTSAVGDYSTSGNQITFSNSGNYSVKVTAFDDYSSATSSVFRVDVSNVIVLNVLIVSYPTAGVTAIDAKHSQEFDAKTSGGTGSYSYSWGISGSSGVVGTSSTYTLNESAPGLYVIWVNITEGSHSASATITIIVNPLPKATISGTSTIETDVGEVISASVVGGTPPYAYAWSVLLYPSGKSAIGDFSTSADTITFTTSGNYTAQLTATDGDGATAIASVIVTVNAILSGSLSLGPSSSSVIDRGNSSLLGVTIAGGSGNFSYQWYMQSPGTSSFAIIKGAINSSYNFVTGPGTTPGIYLFYVNVTDLNTDPAYAHSNLLSVTVQATIVYGVNFTEIGLPGGTIWYLNITGGKSYSSSSTTISLLEPNGSYSYSISTGNKLYRLSSSSISSSSFTIAGKGLNQSVSFLSNVYPVTFSEYGIKTGTQWYVNLSNGWSFSTKLALLSFSEPNGSYSYTIATSNKSYSSRGSSFSVEGASVYVNITFSLITFEINFRESGLPLGTEWYLNLTNGQSFSSNSGGISFSEPNGTYTYDFASVNKIYFSRGGSFTVSGTSVSKSASFSPLYYNITFIEMGLPSGMDWNITLEPDKMVTSNNTSVSFGLVNGSYNFSISVISGYRTQNYSITVVVNGSGLRSYVTWVAVTYPVTITETGLSSGATWSVTLTTNQGGKEKNMTLNTTSNSITFNVTNGSYSYVVTLPQGYKGSPTKSTISVVGSAITTKLKVTPLPNYLLIWIIVGIIAIVLVMLLLLVRSNRKSLFKREGRFLSIRRTKGKK